MIQRSESSVLLGFMVALSLVAIGCGDDGSGADLGLGADSAEEAVQQFVDGTNQDDVPTLCRILDPYQLLGSNEATRLERHHDDSGPNDDSAYLYFYRYVDAVDEGDIDRCVRKEASCCLPEMGTEHLRVLKTELADPSDYAEPGFVALNEPKIVNVTILTTERGKSTGGIREQLQFGEFGGSGQWFYLYDAGD